MTKRPTCTHCFTDLEIAIRCDALCPLCLGAENERLRDDLATSGRLREHANRELAKDSALVERLRAALQWIAERRGADDIDSLDGICERAERALADHR